MWWCIFVVCAANAILSVDVCVLCVLFCWWRWIATLCDVRICCMRISVVSSYVSKLLSLVDCSSVFTIMD